MDANKKNADSKNTRQNKQPNKNHLENPKPSAARDLAARFWVWAELNQGAAAARTRSRSRQEARAAAPKAASGRFWPRRGYPIVMSCVRGCVRESTSLVHGADTRQSTRPPACPLPAAGFSFGVLAHRERAMNADEGGRGSKSLEISNPGGFPVHRTTHHMIMGGRIPLYVLQTISGGPPRAESKALAGALEVLEAGSSFLLPAAADDASPPRRIPTAAVPTDTTSSSSESIHRPRLHRRIIPLTIPSTTSHTQDRDCRIVMISPRRLLLDPSSSQGRRRPLL